MAITTNNNFLKSDTPEVWTKEVYRNQQFLVLETNMFDAELIEDYGKLLRLSRIYLRLQMEVMEERVDTVNDEGEKKSVKELGMKTPLFQNMKREIDELEYKWSLMQTKKLDPVMRSNDHRERRELIKRIQNLQDGLFHNNTVLGLNYKKKMDVMKAAYS